MLFGFQDNFNHKRQKFIPEVPIWEIESGFNPLQALGRKRRDSGWVNIKGETFGPSSHVKEAEDVASGDSFSLNDLQFRDPNYFVAGSLSRSVSEWKRLQPPQNVLDWVQNGVDIFPMFRHFKGNFKGKSYDSDKPVPEYFQNAKICKNHTEFIVKTLEERIENGSLSVLGRVGEVDPPFLILPITVEPTKPRMCHDERFLNLWICDSPFQLDTLKEVPRLVENRMFMSSLDDKSGYDHILLHPRSRPYFGIQYGGWYLVYNTIPFGFKASAYIYHTTGSIPIGYCRSFGVPALLYIDDRLLGEFGGGRKSEHGDITAANRSLYILCQVLVRLGYFLNLGKCVLTPTQSIKFLGMICDSKALAFRLPEDKKASFCSLRDSILKSNLVDLKTLQRFSGKCISFVLAVPAARLFSREVNRAISLASKNSKDLHIYKELKEELEFWLFLDNWQGVATWRREQHLQIVLATDSSLFKWGACIILRGKEQEFGDFWEAMDERPIHVKEASALSFALQSVVDQIMDKRVDAYCDNQAVVAAWNNQGARDSALNSVLKEIFHLSCQKNFDLRLHYINTKENPADKESRRLSRSDCRLSDDKWKTVEEQYGHHTVDLMALDSNAMRDGNGNTLRHFTPHPSRLSAGVNVFSQDLSKEENPYVFPPFNLVFPLLKYFEESALRQVTVILPSIFPRPVWWPMFCFYSQSSQVLGEFGEKGVLYFPGKKDTCLINLG